jgi:hypothetical protein
MFRRNTMKRYLSLLLTFIIIFSLFSDVITVHADPIITGIRFSRVFDPAAVTAKDTLYIYGAGFYGPNQEKPSITIGALGIPGTINFSLSGDNILLIDDEATLNEIIGKPTDITVRTLTETGYKTAAISLDLSVTPTITGVSSAKVYVGNPLIISGSKFNNLNSTTDTLIISGTSYTINAEGKPYCTVVSDGTIRVDNVQSGNTYGVSDIRIERTLGNSQIQTIYRNGIKVVKELTGIKVERIDPNAGPVGRKNVISIYGQPGFCDFEEGMRIFVEGNEGRFIEVLKNAGGDIIGISFELPIRNRVGVVDLVMTSSDLSSEYVMANAYLYMEFGNYLSIDSDGINPNFAKESTQQIVQIKGKNIGYFNYSGYDNLTIDSEEPVEYIGHNDYMNYIIFKDKAYYKVKYTGVYETESGPEPVTIIRQIRTTIDGDAKVYDAVYDEETSYKPIFRPTQDIIYVKTPIINLDPNEARTVDVTVQTITTVFRDTGGTTLSPIYSRTEEYTVKDGFTYLPDQTAPTITTITPSYGPSDKEIYMTIKGMDFEVLEDGTMPKVTIGGRECIVTGVYNDSNKVVDGRIITLGTKIKLKLPAGGALSGAQNVVVINPSEGQDTLENGFEFRNPPDEEKMPFINSVKESYADLRGGDVSGESVFITGGNFFTSSDTTNHRLVITIDGENAKIVGKVSSDGKTVTIIPPPGTIAGKTMLQIINEDGSMTSAEFEYRLVTSAPKITKIAPTKGGKGTKMVIIGEDFVLPDDTVPYNDPKRKGSVVLLNGYELNAYKYNEYGDITSNTTNSIYYEDLYDPDGSGPLPAAYLDGHMVKVQDIRTIYVDIPDRFYSFLAGTPPYLRSSPELQPGQLKVEVLNPDGARSKENFVFNYLTPSTQPVITKIDPNEGSTDGGAVVTIIGSDFREHNLEVYFGSEKSQRIEFVNSTMIRVLVPRYPYELPDADFIKVPVTVLNHDGGVAVSYDESEEDGFIYRKPGSHPIIESIEPKTGSAAGKDRVVIRGSDFRRSPDHSAEGLPKVYFGGVEAEVEWPAGNDRNDTAVLTVTTPRSLISGPVDVVLVNFDAGTYTYKSFIYSRSQPSITSITPNSISNLGNINVQINGRGFRQGAVENLFTISGNIQERVNRHTTESTDASEVIDTVVAFGDQSTSDKKTIDVVLGPNYTVMEELRFDCDANTPGIYTIKVSRADDPSHSALRRYYLDADGTRREDAPAQVDIEIGSSHMFIINHKMDLGSNVSYDEGILIETTPSSVIITRRMAPYAKIQYEGTQLTVKAPPIAKLGSRTVYVINDDGGTATGTIRIESPDSRPVITSIDPKNRGRLGDQIVEYNPNDLETYSATYTFVPQEGGAFLTITGTDFRRGVKVYLNDKPLDIVSKSANDDQLVVTVPPGTEADLDKDYWIVVVNNDSGNYDSTMMPIPHYIRYQAEESNPVIESIVPNRSSSRGDNTIAIHGDNFRLGVKVFIDGVEAVTTREGDKPYALLSVRVPPNLEPGPKTVQVQNPDFGFCEVKNGITIISTPGIERVFNEKGAEIDPLVLSVEGGEKIRLEGVQFYQGARVIIGGTLKAKSELEPGESGIEGLNINNAEVVVIGGILVTDAVVQGNDTITFTTPKLDVGRTSIIIVNTDGGVSSEVSGSYQKPVPDTPKGLKAEAVDGDTIKLEWDKVENVNYYEIYSVVSLDGKTETTEYKYLGSIIPAEISETRVRYFLDGLLPSTWYKIRIKSVNLFGGSKFSGSTGFIKTLDSDKVSFYQGDDAYVSGLLQNDTIEVKGSEVIYSIGEKSINSSKGAYANFSQPSYLLSNPKTVKISYGLIKKYPNGLIRINDRDMELSMTANNLAVDQLIMVERSLQRDTEMLVTINNQLGARGDEIRLKLPRGYSVINSPVGIELGMQTATKRTRIESFKGDISMLLRYAESKKSLYPGGIYIAYYDNATKRIRIIDTETVDNVVKSKISQTGEYILIGKMIK